MLGENQKLCLEVRPAGARMLRDNIRRKFIYDSGSLALATGFYFLTL